MWRRLLTLHVRSEARRGDWVEAGRLRAAALHSGELCCADSCMRPATWHARMHAVRTWPGSSSGCWSKELPQGPHSDAAFCASKVCYCMPHAAGNAVPYVDAANPGTAPGLNASAAGIGHQTPQHGPAASVQQHTEAGEAPVAESAAAARQRSGRFPACPAGGEQPKLAPGSDPPRSFVFNELSSQQILAVDAAMVRVSKGSGRFF